MKEVKTLNKIELKKIYNLTADILKDCNDERYQYVFLGPDAVRVVDGYRQGKYNGYFFESPVAIPHEVIQTIKGVNPFKVEMMRDEGILTFKLIDKKDDEIFTIKIGEPKINIPDFEMIEKRLKDYVDCMEFETQYLQTALILYKKQSNKYIFDLMNKQPVMIIVDKKDRVHTTLEMRCFNKKTRPFKIALDPKFLLDYVKRIKGSDTVKIEFLNSSTFVHLSEYKDAYDYILMPIAMVD